MKQGRFLPVEPFREWLAERVPDANTLERGDWCRRYKIDASHVTTLLTGDQQFVHIDVVDRVLLEYGANINDVYPAEGVPA